MARFRVKRVTKSFGVIDAAQNAAGGTLQGAGSILDSGLGKITGAALGAGIVPTAMGAIGTSVSGALGSLTPLGALGGAILGWQAAKYGGKALKSAGEGMKE